MIKTISIIPGNACIISIDNIEAILDMDTWKKYSKNNEIKLSYTLVEGVSPETKCIVCTKNGFAYPSTFRQTVLKRRIDRADEKGFHEEDLL